MFDKREESMEEHTQHDREPLSSGTVETNEEYAARQLIVYVARLAECLMRGQISHEYFLRKTREMAESCCEVAGIEADLQGWLRAQLDKI